MNYFKYYSSYLFNENSKQAAKKAILPTLILFSCLMLTIFLLVQCNKAPVGNPCISCGELTQYNQLSNNDWICKSCWEKFGPD